MLLGLSVDYVIHMAESYVQCGLSAIIQQVGSGKQKLMICQCISDLLGLVGTDLKYCADRKTRAQVTPLL